MTKDAKPVNAAMTKHLLLSWMHLAFIALGLTVLCWGTGYKVSLYYPPQSSVRLIPCAKLLSRDEQQATREQDADVQPPRPAPVSLAAFMLGLLSLLLTFLVQQLRGALVSRIYRESGRSWHLHQRAGMSFFFVLPPPAVL
ncbi:hypothetical protein [Silvibacterium dinghuense]|uniref:Uncharacterized protein n=1 Tax=Silvibacterium dinghuense TaxID=1560006 RepID=A0A4Q1S8D2_9BACT|nr:hypothetical protein [Silvibacterium dinghuense]RXS93267.1 hypothetical protein ESZ00_18055 [Silvibacterium dinghuense]